MLNPEILDQAVSAWPDAATAHDTRQDLLDKTY